MIATLPPSEGSSEISQTALGVIKPPGSAPPERGRRMFSISFKRVVPSKPPSSLTPTMICPPPEFRKAHIVFPRTSNPTLADLNSTCADSPLAMISRIVLGVSMIMPFLVQDTQQHAVGHEIGSARNREPQNRNDIHAPNGSFVGTTVSC